MAILKRTAAASDTKDLAAVEVEKPKRTAEKKVVSEYTITELSTAAHLLESTRDIVKTALSLDGKEHYGLEEAKEIVTKFSSKKVK